MMSNVEGQCLSQYLFVVIKMYLVTLGQEMAAGNTSVSVGIAVSTVAEKGIFTLSLSCNPEFKATNAFFPMRN
jgi:hypothetical protein